MSLALYVSAPTAAFRVGRAREYWETYPVPPPATVYGLLLSLVGEKDRERHVGAQLSLALLSRPVLSVVLRSQWRVKDRKLPPGTGKNVVPDFQEILTDLQLLVCVQGGVEEREPTLRDRVAAAMDLPKSVKRFGALCLGESTHLVDVVRRWDPRRDPDQGEALLPSEAGALTLPVWVDHVGSVGTSWRRYGLSAVTQLPEGLGEWTTIAPPSQN